MKKCFVVFLCLIAITMPLFIQAYDLQEYVYNISFSDNYTSPSNNYIYDDVGFNYKAQCSIPVAYFTGQLYRDRWFGDQDMGTTSNLPMTSTTLVVRWEGINSGDYDYYFKFKAYNNYFTNGTRAPIEGEFKLLSVQD